jgi:REP element-mobilizing transposase RayT
MSRVVDRRRVFGKAEKDELVRLMRVYEKLYGLRVVTFCVMSDHFHVLVEVPRRPDVLPGKSELLKLIRESHGALRARAVSDAFAEWERRGNTAAIEEERQRWFRQMWDVSRFMKILKQRFTQWYNSRQRTGRRRRVGTLWEQRFRSVLVERGEALRAVAAYIDLNPVRARLVSDPKDYGWSGYGQACAGNARAREGLLVVARAGGSGAGAAAGDSDASGLDVLAWYRDLLLGRGFGSHLPGEAEPSGFGLEQVGKGRDRRARLPVHLYVRQRVRYFTHGLVLGSEGFVDSIFQESRHLFSRKRETGAKRLRGIEFDSPLRTARGLVVDSHGSGSEETGRPRGKRNATGPGA